VGLDSPCDPWAKWQSARSLDGVNPTAPVLDRPWRRPGTMRYVIRRIRGLLRPPIIVYQPPADLVDDRDLAVPTRDGTTLRANVFRRPGDARRPVILSIHPYGKDNLPRRRRGR
jgi:predicted acyl esterase